MVDVIARNAKSQDFYHTHATGSFGYKWMPEKLKEKGFDIDEKSHIDVKEYIYDMPLRLSACDAVVCRAGAITLGEVTALGKPSVLIPSPNVTNNHQYHNAMSLVNENAALIIEEKDLTSELLYEKVLKLKSDNTLCKTLSENASRLALVNAAEEIYKNL